MRILVVTGTGTDVGKTIATASLAACAPGSVAVVKPAQTGVGPDEPGDLAEITRLSGCADVHEYARYPDPLAPHHAAARSELPYLDREKTAYAIAELAGRTDLVLVEGAGGLLVPYDDQDWTMLDLAADLRADLLLVTAAGLGTINHTVLTIRAIHAAGISLAGVLIGSWPRRPGLAERCNLDDLAASSGTGGIAGVLPAGMSTMADFSARARASLAPRFSGTFDWAAFRAEFRSDQDRIPTLDDRSHRRPAR
jgi:dethiobiotin synthase